MVLFVGQLEAMCLYPKHLKIYRTCPSTLRRIRSIVRSLRPIGSRRWVLETLKSLFIMFSFFSFPTTRVVVIV